MRLAYADPPYPGNAEKVYGEHPDFAGEVDHVDLIGRLVGYDGWALSTSARALRELLPLCPAEVRVLAWIKHTVDVAWEPVLVRSARPVRDHRVYLRDWIRVEPDAYQWRAQPAGYVTGQKPAPFCRWLFQWLGAQPGGDDTLDDLYPGSGQVSRVWQAWNEQPELGEPPLLGRRYDRSGYERLLEQQPTLLDPDV
jgi:hypothetical protein